MARPAARSIRERPASVLERARPHSTARSRALGADHRRGIGQELRLDLRHRSSDFRRCRWHARYALRADGRRRRWRHGLRPCAACRRQPASPCAAAPPPPDRSARASEYCAVPAAPSISATAAECKRRELRLQAGRGLDHAGDGENQRVHPQRDLVDRGGIDLVAVADRDHGVDQRMQHHAAGVRLVAVALDQPGSPRPCGQVLWLGGVAVDPRKALLALDDLLRAS